MKILFLACTCDEGRFWKSLGPTGAVTPMSSFKTSHVHDTAGNTPQYALPGFGTHHLLSREAVQLLAVTLRPYSISLCRWVSNRIYLGGDHASFKPLTTSEIAKE